MFFADDDEPEPDHEHEVDEGDDFDDTVVVWDDPDDFYNAVILSEYAVVDCRDEESARACHVGSLVAVLPPSKWAEGAEEAGTQHLTAQLAEGCPDSFGKVLVYGPWFERAAGAEKEERLRSGAEEEVQRMGRVCTAAVRKQRATGHLRQIEVHVLRCSFDKFKEGTRLAPRFSANPAPDFGFVCPMDAFVVYPAKVLGETNKNQREGEAFTPPAH
eukprot:TRINITY_DN3907_c0_g1_i2.p2 TRINITY_DN3907_c0_g1~~TRINITY_DN3907_c0_g1_i2.p2  ORF type:complete len:216 (+),score=56.65 TRINITY_DN3907_c0_g1_i2:52-699(+)